MSSVLLDHVRKVFPGGVTALDDLGLEVRDGEMLAVLGPSGSGKTTLLRLVAGLDGPTSGVISFDGRPVEGVRPGDRNVAVVFQDGAVYPHMTVRGNLAFGAKMRGAGPDVVARRVADAAALLGLTPLLDRLPRTLSGGERRRVALGRAVVVEPACTLYDEPLASLDGPLAHRLRGELRALHGRLGRTAVYVTHEHEEALFLGDRVAVLAEGRVRQVGTPDDVYRRPADRFVAGFVGDPPMSFVEGVFEDGVFQAPGGLRVAVDPPARPCPNVVLGVRPSALSARDTGEFVVRVEDVAVVGDHADVSGRTPGGAVLTARLPAAVRPRAGETLTLAADRNGLHLFEPGVFGEAL